MSLARHSAVTIFGALYAGALHACGPAPARVAPVLEATPNAPRLSLPTTSSAHSAPAPEPARTSTPAPPPALAFTFTRVRDVAIGSLAAGKPPKIAALSPGELSIFDRSEWQNVAVPEALDAELVVEVFFGRDDQPRLMGYRGRSGQVAAYYRRFKGGRFRPEPSELGPLASPNGALYGVLGHEDPEVVCRPKAFCLVKRVSGWGRAPAHDEPVPITLAAGHAWALLRDRIERLDDNRWVALEPARAWSEPIALAGSAEGTLWVLERGKDVVWQLAGSGWEAKAAPIHAPRAIAGGPGAEAWLVGDGGAARFDGSAWQLVDGVKGPLHVVLVAGAAVWLGGGAGLFRGVRQSPLAAQGSEPSGRIVSQ